MLGAPKIVKSRKSYVKPVQESKAEQLRESREILEQVSRDIETEKRMALKAKQQKARAMQEILEVSSLQC